MDSIYVQNNEYGFRYNVNHSYIKPFFKEYCRMANDGFWYYPIADLERIRFECIMDHMLKIGAEKRKEYFERVIKNMKPLDFERIHINKKADRVITAKLLLKNTISLQKTN